MQVDTSRDAVDRLALRMEGIARQTTVYASLDRAHAGDAAATLRALLARAEAAETARDFARMCAESAIKTCGDMENERYAALAELDAAREALRRIAGRSDPVADVVIARAALGAASAEGAKDDPHAWKGEGPAPARWTAPDGTIVYRSYEDYCDD